MRYSTWKSQLPALFMVIGISSVSHAATHLDGAATLLDATTSPDTLDSTHADATAHAIAMRQEAIQAAEAVHHAMEAFYTHVTWFSDDQKEVVCQEAEAKRAAATRALQRQLHAEYAAKQAEAEVARLEAEEKRELADQAAAAAEAANTVAQQYEAQSDQLSLTAATAMEDLIKEIRINQLACCKEHATASDHTDQCHKFAFMIETLTTAAAKVDRGQTRNLREPYDNLTHAVQRRAFTSATSTSPLSRSSSMVSAASSDASGAFENHNRLPLVEACDPTKPEF